MTVIQEYCSMSGALDFIRLTFPELGKLEYDDLRKIIPLVQKRPKIAVEITEALINNNMPALYKKIRRIMVDNQIIAKSDFPTTPA